MGIDKVSLQERIAWVEERRELWERIAADPLGNREWCSKDAKPWQALAAIFEWTEFLAEGYGYESHLNVMSDGTCNGIQHLSALTLDSVSGTYVNLTPSEKPQDIYKLVAGELQAVLERIAQGGGYEGQKASYWLSLTGGEIPRSATKRQVMVLPYGGSKDSFYRYTREWINEHDPIPESVSDMHEDDRMAYLKERGASVSFLVTHMWDVVNKVVKGGMTVMKWLQDCAKAAAMSNQPIYWVTPTGFVVRHFYGVLQTKKIDVLLDGERYQLVRAERTNKLSLKEQLQGISPNFIHSLDASALTETLRLCKLEGITSFASVHDAYGTHAANMWPLARVLRQAFVNVHKANPLLQYRNACLSVIVAVLVGEEGMDPFEASQKADAMLPPMLELGDLVLEDVLASDYFFA
jgi:DNA-directed RNA polymerase